jgi:hypothetical protein
MLRFIWAERVEDVIAAASGRRGARCRARTGGG